MKKPSPSHSSPAASALRLGLTLAIALPLVETLPATAQSLWKENNSGVSLVADKKAHAVGDIVTILVQESNSATKNNSTATSKKNELDAKLATFLFSPAASGFLTKSGQLPAIKWSGSHTFDGGGKINNSETMAARIAVRVVEVLPNGNLVLEGSKKTSVAGETQDAVLRGVVRPEDVSANNTVFSYNVSDATIKYVSSGPVTDAQRKGWFTKIWDKISPF